MAQLHFGDIILTEVADTTPRLATNTILADGQVVEACVFTTDLNELDQTLNPGFDSEPASFPSSADMAPYIRSALREWDGTSFVISDSAMEIRWGPIGPVTTPAADPVSPIVTIPVGVSSGGVFHYHYKFTLVGPETSPGVRETAPDGVYLLELEFGMTPSVLAPSEPFWMVFNHDDTTETHEQAAQWVNDNLAWCDDPFATACDADIDGDDQVTVLDLLDYLSLWFVGDLRADRDNTEPVDVIDLLQFLSAWFEGCDA